MRENDLQQGKNARWLTHFQDWMSDTEAHKQAMRSSIELPPLHSNNLDPTSEPFSHLNAVRRRELLPSILSTSPPGRSSTLPPIQRNPAPNRPRKQSVSKRAREPQHRRQKSRGENAHLRRMSYDRKAYSAEPSSGRLTNVDEVALDGLHRIHTVVVQHTQVLQCEDSKDQSLSPRVSASKGS